MNLTHFEKLRYFVADKSGWRMTDTNIISFVILFSFATIGEINLCQIIAKTESSWCISESAVLTYHYGDGSYFVGTVDRC